MIVKTYMRRVRTEATLKSMHTGENYARAYRWGYRDGSTIPEWFRVGDITATHRTF